MKHGDADYNPPAQKQFAALPGSIQARIRRVFMRLQQWPAVSGAKALRGNLAGCFRIRTGDYRVQFRVTGPVGALVVTVEKIGHRDGFYDE
ncbi:MAG: type II toxin-antitoxin system RelE/ParE family toxin [Planctomycetes bacterium]|nr:type II toxin-antitoxin system RelE/ParE family toxin [Planctomycetota bacterium]